MNYSENEMCTILLSTSVGMNDDSDVKPLTLGEWNKFIGTLTQNSLEPKLVYGNEVCVLKDFGYDDQFIERIKKLADRGASVTFELDEYDKKGIQVLTFISKKYPLMFRRQLKGKMPPVLFYCGDIELANKVGIGVVGSRNISLDGVDFTTNLVKKATEEHLIVYSGGAKGVDVTSQTVALSNGGAVVSYITDSLSSKIKGKDATKEIADGRLLLVSDVKPNVGFSVGRAMNRNKYIYASAFGTFVVESDYNKGGTWTGATEAMKNQWGKVLVWNNKMQGNQKLIEQGGTAYEISNKSLMDVINDSNTKLKETTANETQKNSDTTDSTHKKNNAYNFDNYQQLCFMDIMAEKDNG